MSETNLKIKKEDSMDNILNIIRTQKESIIDLEKEINLIKNSDISVENESLRAELSELSEKHKQVTKRLKKSQDENIGLKNTLYGQIYNEKISILNLSKEKLDIYFQRSHEEGFNRLSSLENSIKYRIEQMNERLKRSHISEGDELHKELNELNRRLNEKIAEAKYQYSQTNTPFSEEDHQEFERMKEEQLSSGQISALAKKNNLEAFIGKNLINKLGVLLIIIGVIAASQFTFLQMSDQLKGICIFALGAAMLVLGEFLNRKKANVFSLGITAGGVAVLYVAATVSYFNLKILTDYPAIFVIVLITAVAFILSIRYNAMVITAFALIGGYLPIFSIGGSPAMVYGAMIYFVILNLFALLISFNKKWTACSYIGLILNIAGTCYIALFQHQHINKFAAIGYILLTFLVYTAIPVMSTYITSKKFKKPDVILLAINTFMSAIIMYISFDLSDLGKFNGLLAIIFAATYLGLGRFIETKFKNEKNAAALFYLTGLAFSILIIPFQFGRQWLTLGWLLEGLVLTAYGIWFDEKIFKRTGYFIDALCLAAFIIFDVWLKIDHLFFYKYMAITISSIVILAAYVMKKQQYNQAVYKALTIINLWIYSLYIVNEIEIKFSAPDFLSCFLSIIFTYLIAYGCIRIKKIADRVTEMISMVLFIISGLYVLLQNGGSLAAYDEKQVVFAIIVLILANITALLAIKTVLQLVIVDRKISIEWYPLLLSGFFVILLTQNLVVQFDLGFSSIVLSLIYAATSVLWIIFGFARRYAFLRRFGLGLSMLSVVKLFLVDLHSISEMNKIISYFALGVSMLAISFIYQYFSKRIEGTVLKDD